MLLNNSFDQIKWQDQFFNDLEQDLIDPIFGKKEEETTDGQVKEEREPFSFDRFDSQLFSDSVLSRNVRVLQVVQKIFNQEVPELAQGESVCIAMTGSDGRQEKLCSLSSKIELIVIVKNREEFNLPVMAKIQTVLSEHSSLFHPELEFKNLQEDSLICFNRNQNVSEVRDDRPFPTRALDALYVVGSPSVMLEYKTQFYEELRQKGSNKLLQKFHDSAVKPMVKLLKEATARTNVSGESASTGEIHIDLEKGQMHYDGQRIKATKYPLLRVVQYKLGHAICKAVHKDALTQEAFLSMPVGILERIDWLVKEKVVNLKEEEVQSLKKAYSASLVWFAQAQQRFRKDGVTVTSESAQSMQAVANCILNVGTNPKVFERSK